MALTDRDLVLYAQAAVCGAYQSGPNLRSQDIITDYRRTPIPHRRMAVCFFEKAQRDVRDSGYRVTERVKDGLWAELERIGAEADEEPRRRAA